MFGCFVPAENAISGPIASTFEGVSPKSGSFSYNEWNGSTLSNSVVVRKLSTHNHTVIPA